MSGGTRLISRALLPLATLALPVVLLVSSLRTLNELDQQKSVFLRNRAAAAAGRLETFAGSANRATLFEALSEAEPALVDLQLFTRGQPSAEEPSLTPLWEGQELFRTELVRGREADLYRVYVPFHAEDGLRIARIDLDAQAAEFLVTHARHNVAAASLGGLVLVALSLYAVWASRRTARLEVRQLELEHLAQLGEMSAVLAHEIRNPLGTIKGFAQLIGEQQGQSVRGSLDPILSEVERLENLVSDLLLYGRPPAPSLRPAKWEEILATLEAHAGHLARERGIRFTAERPAIEWRTDPRLLQHALLNLLRNAAEAVGGRAGGEVRVEVRRTGPGGVTITVADNGPGIPATVREKLFKPFFTTKPSGTGLGLAIARSFARALGGELALSDAEPTGVAASLRFPDASARQVTMEEEA